ncbi:transposase, partial [Candidatus Peregrinibacteria bacterium]|nr:transposase [Candidatus Peregrinibacteria bacterium]
MGMTIKRARIDARWYAHNPDRKRVYWRNLKKLHHAARERVQAQDNLIKEQAEHIRLLLQENALQKKLIETLTLRVEELETMVLGRKRKDHNQHDDPSSFSSPPKSRMPRDASSYHRTIPSPEDITKEETHTIDSCPDGNTPLTKIKTIVYYEEDIVLPQEPSQCKTVIKRHVEKGYCTTCTKWRPALPLPPTSVVIGSRVRAFVSYASIILRLSYDQIQHLLNDLYAFSISQGEIANILDREAVKLTSPYEQRKTMIREQIGVHYDETGWKVPCEDQGNHAWVMTGTKTPDAVFLMGRSRGKGNAEEWMGGNNAQHIGISDDYGAYRTLLETHQLCFVHPLRKLRDLAQSDTLDHAMREQCRGTYAQFSSLYADLRAILATPFDLEERIRVRDQLITRLQTITLPHPNDPQKLKTI